MGLFAAPASLLNKGENMNNDKLFAFNAFAWVNAGLKNSGWLKGKKHGSSLTKHQQKVSKKKKARRKIASKSRKINRK